MYIGNTHDRSEIRNVGLINEKPVVQIARSADPAFIVDNIPMLELVKSQFSFARSFVYLPHADLLDSSSLVSRPDYILLPLPEIISR